MAKDPLHLTKADRSKIIAYYRENRKKFIAGNKAAGQPEKPPKPTKRPKIQLSLDDLDI
jgi:hypothetical protein